LKQKHFIDTNKFLTFIVVLLMMNYFCTWRNLTSWIYLSLHGSYGIMWVIKSNVFPDKTWEREASIWYGLYLFFGMFLYWISPFLVNSGYFNGGEPVSITFTRIFGIITMFIFGVFIHFTSDMYKHAHLKLNPNTLITSGMFKYSRNINYFGELLIYLSFAMLSNHWMPVLILFLIVVFVWYPNMIEKDVSLSRYEGFEEYKKRSYLFIPFVY